MINLLPMLWTALQICLAGTVELQVDGKIYAGVPFVLSVVARDFEESPEPVVGDLSIKGCEVSYLGVSPSVSTRMSIINGRRSVQKDVSFVYSYRVLPPKAGEYLIPAVEVGQGGEPNPRPAASPTAR